MVNVRGTVRFFFSPRIEQVCLCNAVTVCVIEFSFSMHVEESLSLLGFVVFDISRVKRLFNEMLF